MSSGSETKQNVEEQKFSALFPEIVSAIVSSPQFSNVPEIATRVKELLEYNSTGGDKTRGLMTVRAYQMLQDEESITEESMRMARILGWCVELFQTSLVILDDMADNSTTRRGRLCWYKRPDVGYLVVNDSLLLLTVIFDLLKNHFGDRDCYADILSIFKEALSQLCIGQYPTLAHSKDYARFTMDNFTKYCDYKRTYYTFKLPVYISLLLAGKPYKGVLDNLEDILTDMGLLITMQNDYTDCFGDETTTGKAGTDIQEGKCSWLAVSALARCSAAQRDRFRAAYASADPRRVQAIKDLYEELHLPDLYRELEKNTYDSVVSRIQALPADNFIPSALLLELFEMVFQMKID